MTISSVHLPSAHSPAKQVQTCETQTSRVKVIELDLFYRTAHLTWRIIDWLLFGVVMIVFSPAILSIFISKALHDFFNSENKTP